MDMEQSPPRAAQSLFLHPSHQSSTTDFNNGHSYGSKHAVDDI